MNLFLFHVTGHGTLGQGQKRTVAYVVNRILTPLSVQIKTAILRQEPG